MSAVGASAYPGVSTPIEETRATGARWAVWACVTGLTVFAAILRLYHLGSVPMNPFYDAAVRSMSQSWHNFFFAAFEPSGAVAVDKPPLSLWLQVASTGILGFNSFALKLPEALAGIAAVPLLYDLGRRLFGTGAGLAAAATLAVLPVSVVTARSDTMDSIAMLLAVLAAWLVVLAAERSSTLLVLLAGAVVGLNFEVKFVEGLMPVAALALLYVMASSDRARVIAARLVAAALVALLVAAAWPLAVLAQSPDQRPFVLGSTNGSLWGVIAGFNGANRIDGGSAATGGLHDYRNTHAISRMFQPAPRALGELFGATLLAALLFGAAGLALSGGAMLRGPPGDAVVRMRRAGIAATLLWLLTVGAPLAVMSRLHPRYLDVLSPAVALTLGGGLAWTARATLARWRVAAAIAIAGVLAIALWYVHTLEKATVLTDAIAAAFAAAAVLAAIVLALENRDGVRRRDLRLATAAGSLALAALLVSPFAVSARLIGHSYTDSNYGPTDITRAQATYYANFFARNLDGAKYQAIVRTPSQAASLVMQNGLPLILLMNVGGGKVAKLSTVENAVNNHEVRYALLGSHCSRPPLRSACPPAARWIAANAKLIRPSVGLYEFKPAAGNGGG